MDNGADFMDKGIQNGSSVFLGKELMVFDLSGVLFEHVFGKFDAKIVPLVWL